MLIIYLILISHPRPGNRYAMNLSTLGHFVIYLNAMLVASRRELDYDIFPLIQIHRIALTPVNSIPVNHLSFHRLCPHHSRFSVEIAAITDPSCSRDILHLYSA